MPSFSQQARERIEAMRAEYPDARSLLIPVLKIAQKEFGHLDDETMDYVGSVLDLPRSVVAGVATFYHNFHVRPRGKHLVSVCRTLSCELGGAREVSRRLQELLDIRPGETSEDGLVTLHEVECLACCGTAPAVQIDFEYFESFSPEQWEDVIAALKAGEWPEGGSGVPGGPVEEAAAAPGARPGAEGGPS